MPESRNPVCYMDVQIGQQPIGRVLFELFADDCPKTAENFRCLCTGESKNETGETLHYKSSTFHSVYPGWALVGGDIVNKNGTSGESIYGQYFDDENFSVKHNRVGLLSMMNFKNNTNNSQVSTFHSVYPGWALVGGDIVNNNGTSGESIYGQYFDDENFSVKHNRVGLLSMMNFKNNTNNSQVSTFHSVYPGWALVGGDIVNNNGTSGESIYGQYFDDENFSVKHNRVGLLSMMNFKNNTNNSQVSTFHSVYPGWALVGGDIVNNNGTSGESIYGQYFDDENFSVKHNRVGLLSMMNFKNNTNNSQVSTFHSVYPGWALVGGDIVNNNGTSGESIYGQYFDDENFSVKHNRVGLLSMMNFKNNTNNSQVSTFHSVYPGWALVGSDIVNNNGTSGESIYGQYFDDENFSVKHNRVGLLSMMNFKNNTNNSQVSTFHSVYPGWALVGGDIVNNNGTSGEFIYGQYFDVENFSVKHNRVGLLSMMNFKNNTNNSQVSTFHSVYPGWALVGSDIVNNNGTSGESIYGQYFDDENFSVKHNRVGLLSMMNFKNNTNNSQVSTFHSVYPGWALVGGDIVNNNGTSGEFIYGQYFDDENFSVKHNRVGLLSMMDFKNNTNNSQVSTFHSVYPGWALVGSDIVNNNGTSGESIYGQYFDDENFSVKHNRVGLLSMMNFKNNTNNSQVSTFHSVYPGWALVGGDIVNNNGTSGESIYGQYFDDENFSVKHNRVGLLSMMNFKNNTNNSQVSTFHSVYPGWALVGGDIVNNNGTSGESIYGQYFDDENFSVKHNRVGLLSMMNFKNNTNNSQVSTFHSVYPGWALVGGDIVNNNGTSGESIYGQYFDDENFSVKHNRVGLLSMMNFKNNTNNSQVSTFHSVYPGWALVGGDIVNNNGTSGESIYGQYFDDENFSVKHNRVGLLSMMNFKNNTNNSQVSTFHSVYPGWALVGSDIVNNNGTSGESIYGQYFDDENFSVKHNRVGLLSMMNFKNNTNNSQVSTFHSVYPGWALVGGDIVNNNGTSGEFIYGQYFDDENFSVKHNRVGLLSMMNFKNNTNNSQVSAFHSVYSGWALVGGDIVNNNGTSGESIYGQYFDDENFSVKHNRVGLLSMMNFKNNTNNSQFVISMCPAPSLDNQNVAFGQVIDGFSVLDKIQAHGDGLSGITDASIRIADCGQLPDTFVPPQRRGMA